MEDPGTPCAGACRAILRRITVIAAPASSGLECVEQRLPIDPRNERPRHSTRIGSLDDRELFETPGKEDEERTPVRGAYRQILDAGQRLVHIRAGYIGGKETDRPDVEESPRRPEEVHERSWALLLQIPADGRDLLALVEAAVRMPRRVFAEIEVQIPEGDARHKSAGQHGGDESGSREGTMDR